MQIDRVLVTVLMAAAFASTGVHAAVGESNSTSEQFAASGLASAAGADAIQPGSHPRRVDKVEMSDKRVSMHAGRIRTSMARVATNPNLSPAEAKDIRTWAALAHMAHEQDDSGAI
jgi:zona occludens toxin (predicted ATPase)